MSIINKIKELFYEEQIIEEKIEKSVKEYKKPELPKEEENNEIVSEREFVKTEQNFKFPIIFEDEDIKEEPKKEKIVEEKREERIKPAYVKPTLDRQVIKEVIEKPRKFSVSPVISPVYGILDKNYKKDEVSNKSDDFYKTKELVINFDTIRQKAYGSLEDELSDIIENNVTEDTNEESVTEIELERTIITNDDLLEGLKENDKDEYDFKDFGVEYKVDDSIKESNEPKHGPTPKDKNNIKSEEIEEKPKTDEVKDEIELTEDLFNLIDSMYDN